MIAPWRAVLLIAVSLTTAACARNRRVEVATRVVEEPVDSTTLRAAPVTRADSVRRDAFVRADSAAARVDTLLVTPAAIRLRVGDSVAIFRAVRVEARDAAGGPVAGFAPLFDVRPSGVARVRAGYLVGVAPGTAVLRLRSVQVTGGVPSTPARPMTEVAVTVADP